MTITLDGSSGVTFPDASTEASSLGNKLTLGTAQASTSGTSIDFTGIPSWVRRITVMFDGVSTNGTSQLLIQIGDSGGIETSGYASYAVTSDTTPNATVTSSGGFILTALLGVASVHSGAVGICLINSTSWVSTGTLSRATLVSSSSGSKSLSSTLDRVRITTSNGTDTFDAGTINILYE